MAFHWGGRGWSKDGCKELPRNGLRNFTEGKTDGKRGMDSMERDEWRGEEAEGEVRAELVADSGESHLQMNVEQGSCSSGSSLQSSMAGIASESTKILIHTLSKWCDQVHCCKLVIRSPLQLLDFFGPDQIKNVFEEQIKDEFTPHIAILLQ